MKIKKAVIPVAGKGTRFLPATKEIPKEMIPILNIPMIYHVVKEAVDSGVEQIIFVTSTGKESIENYFDRNFELEHFLEKNKKLDYLDLIKKIGSMVEVASVRQKEQLGLGHAILCSKPLVGGEDFAVLLGDDIILNDTPVTKQLMDCYQKNTGSVIGVMEVAKEDTSKYGIVDGDYISSCSKTLKMSQMIEKPSPDKAPSTLATPGRYILQNDIFSYLEKISKGSGGEYQLTDAINLMAKDDNVYAHIFAGDRYDTGSINGYISATLEFALRDDSLRSFTVDIMKKKIKKFGDL